MTEVACTGAGRRILASDSSSSIVSLTPSSIGAAPIGGDASSWRDLAADPLPVGTIQQIADQLTSGYWNGDTHRWPVTQGGSLTVDITTLSPSEQALAREAFLVWTRLIGIGFTEVSSGAQITFHNGEEPGGPVAYTTGSWANGIISSQDIHISSSWVTRYGTGSNTYSFQTYIHEIGHALGLGHPGTYNGDAAYPTDALFANDAWSTSLMSYFTPTENSYFSGLGFTEAFSNTPMVADVRAVQQLYGLSTTWHSGDDTYSFGAGAGAQCIYDAGGNDWLYATSSFGTQMINLTPGSFSNILGGVGNISIALGVIIENAVGGVSADTIFGNDSNNQLIGGEGQDRIQGGAGNDTIVGDGANASNGFADILTGGDGNDSFEDSRANLNGDTITDFARSDRIHFTDASLGSFTFSVSGNVLSYTGGSLTLEGLANVALVASVAPDGGMQINYRGPPLIISAGAPASNAATSAASGGDATLSSAELWPAAHAPWPGDLPVNQNDLFLF